MKSLNADFGKIDNGLQERQAVEISHNPYRLSPMNPQMLNYIRMKIFNRFHLQKILFIRIK